MSNLLTYIELLVVQDAQSAYLKAISKWSSENISALGGLASLKWSLVTFCRAELFKRANRVEPRNDWIKLEYATTARERPGRRRLLLLSGDQSSGRRHVPSKAFVLLGEDARSSSETVVAAVSFFQEAAMSAEDTTEALRQIVIEKKKLGEVVEAESEIAKIFGHNSLSHSARLAAGLLRRAIGDRSGARLEFFEAA